MRKYLDITKPRYSEQIFASPLALRYIEVPLYNDPRGDLFAQRDFRQIAFFLNDHAYSVRKAIYRII